MAWIQKTTAVFIIALLWGGYISASSRAFAVMSRHPDKVYITQDQIRLGRAGIAVDIEGKPEKVLAIYRDRRGYYYEKKAKVCPAHHAAVTPAHECAHSTCPYYYEDSSFQI